MDYTGLYKALEKIVNVVPVVEIGVEGMCLDKVDNLCFSQKKCELYTTLIFQFVWSFWKVIYTVSSHRKKIMNPKESNWLIPLVFIWKSWPSLFQPFNDKKWTFGVTVQ